MKEDTDEVHWNNRPYARANEKGVIVFMKEGEEGNSPCKHWKDECPLETFSFSLAYQFYL